MNNDKRTTREGWYNRHLTALPNKECVINIIHKDIDGEHEHLCEWKPFNKSEYTSANMPGEGYLGTATVIKPPFEGIGFHAWEQNNSQFIYYKIIEHPEETESKKEEGKEGDILEGNKGAKWYLIPAYFKPFRGFSEIVIAEMGIDVTTKLESENKSLREANQRLKEGLQEVIDFLHVLPMLRLANKQGFDECINIEGVKELEAKAKQVLNQ